MEFCQSEKVGTLILKHFLYCTLQCVQANNCFTIPLSRSNFFKTPQIEIIPFWFLGGLSLHLNHLIVSRMANYNWPFGTLPFGRFWSNLDTRDLETYPRTYSDHFWNMSIFDDSRAVWVLFRKWVVSENCILLRNGWPTPGYSDLGGEVPRLNHGPICCPIQNT